MRVFGGEAIGGSWRDFVRGFGGSTRNIFSGSVCNIGGGEEDGISGCAKGICRSVRDVGKGTGRSANPGMSLQNEINSDEVSDSPLCRANSRNLAKCAELVEKSVHFAAT